MNVQCLLCGGRTTASVEGVFDTRFGIDHLYDIGICGSCGLEQILSIPASEELKNLYETYYNFGGEKGTTYTSLRERFLFSFLYRYWLAIDGDISFHGRKGTGKLLDVGCNEGRGLKIYQRNGFVAEGLELNELAASVARSQGFTVYTQLLEEFKAKDSYDAVVLSNVLEHSLNPRDMLSHVSRILKPDGQVWISCPNNESWLRYIFGRYWINWHVPFHIVHFSSRTLGRLLNDSGFDVIDIRQETPSLWMGHSIIAWLFSKKGKRTTRLRSPLLVLSIMMLVRGFLFPVLWIGNRLGHGDCLVVTARKRG